MSFSPGAGPGQPGNHEMAQARAAEHRQNLDQAAAKAERNSAARDYESDTESIGPLRRLLRKLTGRS